MAACITMAWHFTVNIVGTETSHSKNQTHHVPLNDDQFVYSHLEKFCKGSDVDMEYFSTLFFNPADSMGLAYLVFLVAYFKAAALKMLSPPISCGKWSPLIYRSS